MPLFSSPDACGSTVTKLPEQFSKLSCGKQTRSKDSSELTDGSESFPFRETKPLIEPDTSSPANSGSSKPMTLFKDTASGERIMKLTSESADFAKSEFD